MKIKIYALIFPLVLFSGLAIAKGDIKNVTSKKSDPKVLSAAEKKAALKKWEASPDGIMYKKWQSSAAGKKVYASEVKIRKSIQDFTNMEAIVTSLSLPTGSRLGFGMMVKIKGDNFILNFAHDKFNNSALQSLQRLKVNDKIIIRSHSVMHAPKYAYPIVSGDYIEQNKKVLYKRAPSTGGC